MKSATAKAQSCTGGTAINLSCTGEPGVTSYSNGNSIQGISGANIGVLGISDGGAGVEGLSQFFIGVRGESDGGTGVQGFSNKGTGVFGYAYSGNGVLAQSLSGYGVDGISSSSSGVYGYSYSGAGVQGYSQSWNAVQGDAYGVNAGVSAANHGGGNGLYAETDHVGSSQNAVYAIAFSSADYAGYFSGALYATSASSGIKAFKIDHPLSPDSMYLYHSSVESPDMKDMYDGTVVLDQAGSATVSMPSYFEALNKDFRYQLTSIGRFSPVYVSSEISGNAFSIAGGAAGQKVSWQVTGVRQDAVANASRIQTEVVKEAQNQGKYLNPEAFGLPATMGINYQPAQKPVQVAAPDFLSPLAQ